MKDEESFLQSSNPEGASGTLEQTEAGSLNEQILDISMNKVNNDSDKTQKNIPRSQTPSNSEEWFLEKFFPIYYAVHKMTTIIEDEYIFTNGLLENLPLLEINTIKSDEEFTLKSVECERVRAINSLLNKMLERCEKLAKSHLAYILNGAKLCSSEMDEEKIKNITKYIRQNFESRRSIHNLAKEINKIEIHLTIYSTKLILSELEFKCQEKGKNVKTKIKFTSKTVQNLVTPIDHDIALILNSLLDSSENLLLPTQRELGLLPKSDLPVRSYSCGDSPKSLRKHMILLEKVLSDTDYLLSYIEAPNSELKEFLIETKEWMDDSISLHKHITSLYLMSSYNVRKLDFRTRSMMKEKYNEFENQYNGMRTRHNYVKKCIYKCNNRDRSRLGEVARSLMEFCDIVDMVDIFVAVLNVFLWLPTVSGKFVELIEDDEKYLNIYAKKMTKP